MRCQDGPRDCDGRVWLHVVYQPWLRFHRWGQVAYCQEHARRRKL